MPRLHTKPTLGKIILSWMRWNFDRGFVGTQEVMRELLDCDLYQFRDPEHIPNCLATVSRTMLRLADQGVLTCRRGKNHCDGHRYRVVMQLPSPVLVASHPLFSPPRASTIALSVLRWRQRVFSTDVAEAIQVEHPTNQNPVVQAHVCMRRLVQKGFARKGWKHRRLADGRLCPRRMWESTETGYQ